jgi:flagellar protein FliO/FliZ
MAWLEKPAATFAGRRGRFIGGAALIALVLLFYLAGSAFQPTTTSGVPPGSDDAGVMGRAVLSLVFIFGLIAAGAFALRQLRRRTSGGANSRQLQILGSIFIGPKKQIMLVRAMNQVLVLGVTEAAINKLAEMRMANGKPPEENSKQQIANSKDKSEGSLNHLAEVFSLGQEDETTNEAPKGVVDFSGMLSRWSR